MVWVRGVTFLGMLALMLGSCASLSVAPPAPKGTATPDAHVAEATAQASVAPAVRRYGRLRVFVASESTDSVWVYEAAPGGPFALLKQIPVGRLPHQVAVSPDGRYVAVNNRMANTTSIIDPVALTELVRIAVGKQPHGITFSADGRTLYVGHERDTYIAAIDVATWTSTAIVTGVPQHVLTISRSRPSELWFTLTNTRESDVLRVVDLATKTIRRVHVGDVHDVFFTPDGSELWSTSSGFLDKPSDRLVIYDPEAKAPKQEIHLIGRYPFHTLKPLQDGMFYPTDTATMLLSDHLGPSLLWVDWRSRRIVGETKLGKQPFHTTYDPEGSRLLVTTNVDGLVNVIDVATRTVVQQVPVPKAHGIASVGLP